VWGEPRFTQDIDIVIALLPKDIESLCLAFPAPEFYVNQSTACEAVERSGQFNVIHPSSGNKIGFMIAGKTAWSKAQLQRTRTVEISPGLRVSFAAPEDVILGKLIYYREGGSDKHLRDIAGILKVSGELVDWHYLKQQAEQLDVALHWQTVLQRVTGEP
jgi:hypothetical protein